MNTIKRIQAVIYSMILLCLFVLSPMNVYADIEQSTEDKINAMVQEHMDKAKITKVSIAFIQNGEAAYLTYGGDDADENSLYQIGSTTKAFTALGVLWLEDEGLLSLNDPVSSYIPWFTMQYNGEDVPGEDLTIANLLYQTSGFTNDEARFPAAEEGMTLEESVRALTSCQLAFYPSTQYAYANANYNTLGCVIEAVSGQSYQEFMDEKILTPLGLQNTYTDPAKAAAAGTAVQGSRLAFFQSLPYEIPVNIASVPAGYILSHISDMSRWLQIHMGLIEVSDRFTRIISKAHTPSESNAVDSSTYYAGGWLIRDDGTIYHPGGTPNFSSQVMLDPDSGTGVCVLTNMNASANTGLIAENIMAILQGQEVSPYQADIWTIFDTIFSILTFVCAPLLLLTIIGLARTVRQAKSERRIRTRWRKKAIILTCLAALLVVFSAVMIIVLPMIFGNSWIGMSVWAPYSLYTGTISFTLFSVGLLAMAILKSSWRKSRKYMA